MIDADVGMNPLHIGSDLSAFYCTLNTHYRIVSYGGQPDPDQSGNPNLNAGSFWSSHPKVKGSDALGADCLRVHRVIK